MEATIKTRMGFLLVVVMLAMGNSLYAQELVDFISISGVVRDANTKKRLEFVNVAVPGTSLGTITNADGEFTIKIQRTFGAERVEVSHIGYKNSAIILTSEDIPDQQIFLVPSQNLIDEIVVRAREPRYLVEEAIRKIPVNYSSTYTTGNGFYRETAQKGRNYISITEAVVNIYKTPYSEDTNKDQVQIHKGRSLLSQKRTDTLVVKLLGGPNLPVFADIVKNPNLLLDEEILPFYAFRMEEPAMIEGRPQYVISFTPRMILPYALYYGLLYIDKESMAFTRAQFRLDMEDTNKATEAILRKKPFGLRFKPLEVSFLVTYTQRGERTYLSYIRNEVRFKCDWKRKLFSTSYTIRSEMVVTENEEKKVGIPLKTAFRVTESFPDKVSDFLDEDFWSNYNIIEPTESLETAVNKLRKQKRQ